MAEVYIPDKLKNYFNAVQSNEKIAAYFNAAASQTKLQTYFDAAEKNMGRLNSLYAQYPEKLNVLINQLSSMNNAKVRLAYEQFSSIEAFKSKNRVNKIQNGRDNLTSKLAKQ